MENVFNREIIMQAQEVIFSRKAVKGFYPTVVFHYVPVVCCSTLKYLGMSWMTTKPWSSYYWKNTKYNNKGIGVMKYSLYIIFFCVEHF